MDHVDLLANLGFRPGYQKNAVVDTSASVVLDVFPTESVRRKQVAK
jgi:hypothetical protein